MISEGFASHIHQSSALKIENPKNKIGINSIQLYVVKKDLLRTSIKAPH